MVHKKNMKITVSVCWWQNELMYRIALLVGINALLRFQAFKRQFHKMAKHTQTIRRQFADELFKFDHFVGLALKGLRFHVVKK